MIEIVCPSCQARYQLPDGSVGSEGRKVSCSSCSHKWRAYPDGEAPAAARPEPEREPAAGPAAAPESMAAVAAIGNEFEDDPAAPDPPPPPPSADRDQQMAAIREMLADLNQGAEAAPEAAPEPRPAPVDLAPPVRRHAGDDEEDRDQLKSRIEQLNRQTRGDKGQSDKTNYDVARLRRQHEKRAKKIQRARDRRKKSGAFLTGFTLVSAVVATMVGLYVLQPQIIAASPQLAPAMNEYVATVDRYRGELNESAQGWREYLVEQIAKFDGQGG